MKELHHGTLYHLGIGVADKGAVVFLLCGCGARTEIGSSQGPPVPCTKPPWVVFDYDSPGISAMRADGSSFHQLDLSGVMGVFPSVAPDSESMTASITMGPNDFASDPTWASGCAAIP